MKKENFLNKLKKEGKLKVVEISEEMSLSYGEKSQECKEVAKLALENNYFESAVTQSYYSMYNNLLSLFFKCGIKCENHSASAIILKNYFNQEELYKIFSKAKEERIDKQYYTPDLQKAKLTKDLALQTIKDAISFNIKINNLKNSLKSNEISNIRGNLKC